MNALQTLQAKAGQKGHEAFFEATWSWPETGPTDFPCTHGDIMRNPPLQAGGFSPNLLVTLTVRDELFGAVSARRPKKGDRCTLTSKLGQTFLLQVGTNYSSTGDLFQRFDCWDRDQGA